MPNLHWNTVNELLQEVLNAVMRAPEFGAFRLVGGTSLSLQIGHRMSVDIDLFTDASYGSIDFAVLDLFFKTHFSYALTNSGQAGMGTSYFVGENEQDAVKIDLYYTEHFIQTACCAYIQHQGFKIAYFPNMDMRVVKTWHQCFATNIN